MQDSGSPLLVVVGGIPPELDPGRKVVCDEGRIDLSGFGGNALFFAGGEDAMWQSDVAAEFLAAQSERFEAYVYLDAGHVFSERLDEFGSGWEIMFGGTAEGGAQTYASSMDILFDRLSRWHGQM